MNYITNMPKSTLFIFLVIAIFSFTQCKKHEQQVAVKTITGSFILKNQAAVDSFVNANKNVKTLIIDGFIAIGAPGPTDIVNISGLSNIEKITGNLNIFNNTQLKSLQGLQNIVSLTNLAVNGNDELLNLIGLDALQIANGFVYIELNHNLESLDGLENLKYIKAGLKLENGYYGGSLPTNASLKKVNLPSLVFIGGDCDFTNQEKLELVELPQLDSIKGEFDLQGILLKSFNGLNNLKYIGANADISKTGATDFEGFTNLNRIDGIFNIYNNDYITSLKGLDSLHTIRKTLYINSNKSLTTLEGLKSLNTVVLVVISGNNSLVDFCPIKHTIKSMMALEAFVYPYYYVQLEGNSPSLPASYSYTNVLTDCP
jgi:hypothetical protein